MFIDKLKWLLSLSAKRHERLCPRQVLGVRMGMYAGRHLVLELPQSGKHLFVFAEAVRCGEEISNEREIIKGGQILCQYCAGNKYYSDHLHP